MKKFYDQPIQRKLMILVLSAIVIAMLIVTVAVTATDQYFFRKTFVEELDVLAELTAQRSGAALLFNDEMTLRSNVDALFIRSSIEKVCVYNSESTLYLGLGRNGAGIKCEDKLEQMSGVEYSNDRLQMVKPVIVKQRLAGLLWIQVGLNELDERLWQFIFMLLIIGVLAAAMAWRLTLRLQRMLVSPIVELSLIANVVSRSSDYSTRVKSRGGDEVGRLVVSFNRLMDSVQEQDIELRERNDQIVNQVEIAKERNKVIREMFSGASHDLRQPLQAMLIFVSALREISTEKQIKLLSKLEVAIDNMSQLFSDLLDVSKLEVKLEKVSFSPVSLSPLLDRVFHEFDALAGDKNLSLRFHVGRYVVKSNPGMLERIVRNLLSNAIRYTEDGGVLLACRKRGNSVWIEVWDTGKGIADDQLDDIFKQFVQLDNTSKESKQGVGLGLSIVKRLSSLLGHKVSVYSRLGGGTLFRLEIPIFNESNELSSRKNHLFIDSDPEEFSGGLPLSLQKNSRLNIVLVDDDSEIRGGLERLLVSWGMDVLSFSSLMEIELFFTAESFKANNINVDLIVSDFQLDNEDTGFDAIELVRKFTLESVPAVIVTGTDDEALLDELQRSEFEVLRKPVKPAKLRALINYVVSEGG